VPAPSSVFPRSGVVIGHVAAPMGLGDDGEDRDPHDVDKCQYRPAISTFVVVRAGLACPRQRRDEQQGGQGRAGDVRPWTSGEHEEGQKPKSLVPSVHVVLVDEGPNFVDPMVHQQRMQPNRGGGEQAIPRPTYSPGLSCRAGEGHHHGQ